MLSPLQHFILDNAPLFWYVKLEAKIDLSIEAVVETILNYGDMPELKRLFDIVGIHNVANIFFRQISRPWINYHPRTVNFFKPYFAKHAQ